MDTNKFNYKIAPPIINKNLSVSGELRINPFLFFRKKKNFTSLSHFFFQISNKINQDHACEINRKVG